MYYKRIKNNLFIRKIIVVLLVLVLSGILFACGNSTNVNSEGAKVLQSIKSADRIELDDAYTQLSAYDFSGDEEALAFVKKLGELKECAGMFIYESEETGDRYTGNISFYLQKGEVYSTVSYSGFMGTISDGSIKLTVESDYLYETETKGDLFGRELNFEIWFSPASTRIKWADVCDYTLTRGNGSAEDLQDYKIPFEETDVYQSMLTTIDNIYKDSEHSVIYDSNTKELFIYVEAPESSRTYLVHVYTEEIANAWKGIVDSTVSLSEQLYAIIHAGHNGKCVHIYWVERLDSGNKYDKDDYLLCVENGEVIYNIVDGVPTVSSHGDKTETETQKRPTGSSYSNNNASSYNIHTETSGERNALETAYDYLDYMAFSYTGLIEQLKFEGYTTSEATYAADNCGANWNEQAVRKAREYLDYMSFSRSELMDQLIFEGFTKSEAEYGVSVTY